MRPRWLTWVFIVALAATAARGAEPEREARPALKIGVVNVPKVFANYKKTQDMDRELRNTREQKQQVADEKRNEITKLRDSIALLEIGTDERKKLEDDLQKKQVEFQSFQKITADTLVNKRRDLTEKLYAEITRCIADHAKEQGLDAVLKMDDTPLTSETVDELIFKINQKHVLYASPRVDITDAVLTRLNKGYSKEVIEK
jgi:Skp family chaperone for outer membrane proteins